MLLGRAVDLGPPGGNVLESGITEIYQVICCPAKRKARMAFRC
ncbi:MAG: hypothetical protein ABSE06_13390 [Anaerolineaceae bacterium]